jgi:hypothetical protein
LAAGATATAAAAFRIQVATDSIPAARLLLADAAGTFLSRALDFVPPSPTDSIWTANSPSSITLSWRLSDDTDIEGYYLYRSLSSSGPFERVHDEVNGMAYYRDENLPALTRFYYQIATVDSSGNHSQLSYMIAASTSVPLMTGWPVQVDGNGKPSGPAFEDLNSATTSDGSIEIVSGGGHLYALEADGREYVDGDRTAVTLGIFSKRGRTIWSTPAIADIDKDHSKEIVVQSWGDFQISGDESLFVFDGTFAKVKPNWPRKIVNGNWGSPAVGNIDADANLEIVAVAGKYVYAWNSNGTEVRDGDGDPTTNGIFAVVSDLAFALYGSPALANIMGDSRDEIIVAERVSGNPTPVTNRVHVYQGSGTPAPGFPKVIGYASTASPAVANLDGSSDPGPEIIVATGDSVLVFHSDGTAMLGGPPYSTLYNFNNFTQNNDMMSSPAIGDLNVDRSLDIVIGSSTGMVFAWTGRTGQILPGWPVQVSTTDSDLGSPVIANLDNDPELEVLITDDKGYVHGLNHDGTLLEGWPYKTGNGIFGSPAIWDMDGNGTTNVAFSSSDQFIYLLELPTVPFDPLDVEAHPWPKFRHDSSNSGWLERDQFVPVALASLTAQHRGGGTVALGWQATSEYQEFRVYRQLDGGTQVRVGSVSGRTGSGYLTYSFEDKDVPDGRYLYWIGAVARDGGTEEKMGPMRVEVATAGLPLVAELLQNSPNPFNPWTTIHYRVPGSLGKARLSLRIYAVSGRLVRTLVDGPQEPGQHSVTWDGRDGDGRAVASGLYLYRLEGAGVSITRKMSLLQ